MWCGDVLEVSGSNMTPGDIEWFYWFPTLVKGFWDIGKKQVVGLGCRCLASTGDRNWTRDPGIKTLQVLYSALNTRSCTTVDSNLLGTVDANTCQNVCYFVTLGVT